MKLRLKDKIKFDILPYFVSILDNFGVSFKYLTKFDFLSKSIVLYQATLLGKIVVTKSSKPQNIFILELLSGSNFHLIIEGLIGLALKAKGHNVCMIIDDNYFPLHELKKDGDELNWDYKTNKGYYYAKLFLSNLGVSFVSVSEFIKIDNSELEYNPQYDSILEASLLKHYKVGVISEDLPSLEFKRELIKNSISISERIGQTLSSLNPDTVIMSHGIYSTWGPAFSVLDNNNIDILVHGRGKKRHTQVFNWNKTGDSWDVSKEWEKVRNKKLSEPERKEIEEYLDSRVSHKDDVFIYNFGNKISNEKTIEYLGLDPSKPIYSLFTNVLWDAASAQREIVFNNPVQWVIETIEWFNNNPNKQLIVKIHPAEIVIGTNMPFYDIIINNIKPKENIRIIRPEEKVNSWSIYNISKLGMVHTTTAGMELPLVRKPCIVVSKTHYRDKGFTIDVNSKEEYFGYLETFETSEVDLIKNRENALKYAHLIFIKYQIPFNLFFEDISTHIKGFRNVSITDYFKDKNFENIINSIELKRDIFQ